MQDLASVGDKLKRSRADTFMRIWDGVFELSGREAAAALWPLMASHPAIPHFTEPWYCCAEPSRDQFVSVARASKAIAQPDAFSQNAGAGVKLCRRIVITSVRFPWPKLRTLARVCCS